MAENIEIKGQIIGPGNTLICVPVIAKRKEDILEGVRQLTTRDVPMVEWRMDWFAQVMDKKAVREILEEMAVLVRDTILLCTFRSKAQGGEKSICQKEYEALNTTVAESGKADIVDLEYYEMEHPAKMIKRLQVCGVKVIASHHNFRETPAVGTMKEQLCTMLWDQADMVKLAVMPQDKTDVLNLMKAVLQARKEVPNGHIAAMSMGMDGMISRVLAGWFGSELTFGAFGEASAPGQLPYDALCDILEKIQESVIKG